MTGGEHPFVGRTVAVIEDLNRQERLYLYRRARELKEALARVDRRTIDRFRIGDPDFGMYEVFLENSTRTRESFKNAAHFHQLKFSELNAATSSFSKSESYADTFANLVGYDNRVFVIRSSLEGVCRYLAEQIEGYRNRHGIETSISFINAGDGRHEHPTQELLDEFTFLEDLDWKEDAIHLALVGDLYHGRTVHSKVHGLGLFTEVRVDLVAPEELSMPRHYVQRMQEQGFRVREYPSIEAYLHQDGPVAPQWYFTRPQLERMGERILRRAVELRRAITFDPALIDLLPEGTVFYHPLPRHREHPTILAELDGSPLNGWERQSSNGWIVRIVLLAMIGGRIGDDYTGPVGRSPIDEPNFVTEVTTGAGEGGSRNAGTRDPKARRYSEGIRPISDGLVIDHIFTGAEPAAIRSHLTTIISVMGLHGRGGEWVSTGGDGRYKGLLFRPGHPGLTEREVRKLAAVVPGATVNIIADGEVKRKYRLGHPARIYGLPELICGNEACITHPANGEKTLPSFRRSSDGAYVCEYCSTKHAFTEVWR